MRRIPDKRQKSLRYRTFLRTVDSCHPHLWSVFCLINTWYGEINFRINPSVRHDCHDCSLRMRADASSTNAFKEQVSRILEWERRHSLASSDTGHALCGVSSAKLFTSETKHSSYTWHGTTGHGTHVRVSWERDCMRQILGFLASSSWRRDRTAT